MLGRRGPCIAAWLVVLACIGCRPAAYRVYVHFPGPVALETGAEVLYQGVPVGRIAAVRLRQERADAPAWVELEVAIEDPGLRLRRNDRFEVDSGGLLGEPALRIRPGGAPGPILADGDTVLGTPPLHERMAEGAEEALERLRERAAEAGAEWLESLESALGPESGSNAP